MVGTSEYKECTENSLGLRLLAFILVNISYITLQLYLVKYASAATSSVVINGIKNIVIFFK